MDIAGAKALKRRLGDIEADDFRPSSADVREGAPPIYHWTGVSEPPAETSADDVADEASTVSLFRRLGLGFR